MKPSPVAAAPPSPRSGGRGETRRPYSPPPLPYVSPSPASAGRGARGEGPNVHTADPTSSRDADAGMRASGAMGSNRRLVYDALKASPDSTAAELLEVIHEIGLPLHIRGDELTEVRRRLSDMERDQVVVRGDVRLCRVARGIHKTAVEWRVNE